MSIRIALTILLTLALASIAPSSQADAGFVLVCHASNPNSSLTSAELKKAFTGGTRQWGNGAVVQIGVTSSDSPELQFIAGTIGMSSAELLSRVQQQVFKGEMRRPVILRSLAEFLSLTRTNAGAICATSAGVALPPEVKALVIR